ncbi:MAG: hypothetical protein E5W99_04215 [Mesorhizobium sp.]|nr:MAG: hypothetical protein E5W99_04215 [Mesorhizobium sp.]
MKGKAKRAGGGVVAKDPSPKEVYAGGGSNVAKEAPGRKSGGRVGADRSPLSEAAKTTGPSAKEGD